MHKSRRWLLASMGASAVAAAGVATTKASDANNRALPTLVDCESLYAKDVGLTAWFPLPHDAADAKKKLFEVIVYGFGYGYNGAQGPLPDLRILGAHLTDAYEDEIISYYPQLNSLTWEMLIAQTFILGQLVRYFWIIRLGPLKQLKPRHLTSAWAVFGRATSSCFCAEWVVGAPGSRNAYVLPKLPQKRETDQPCALCG